MTQTTLVLFPVLACLTQTKDTIWLKRVSKYVSTLSVIKCLLVFCFYNSLIIHGSIHQIVFGYFALYLLLFIAIKSDISTAQNVANNLLKINLIKTRWVIFEDNKFMSKHTFHIQNLSISLFQVDLLYLLIH